MARTALVTGASRGLGFETCTKLEKGGFHVIRANRPELDVTDPASIAAMAERLRREGTTLDVLVNNAGITIDGFNTEVARRTLDVNFFGALHVTDAFLPLIADGGAIVMVSSGMGELSCVSASLRKTLVDPALRRDTLVALMESFVKDVEHGRHGEAGWPSSAYRVSKVGLNALTRVLARDLSSRHIRVNAVCPGWVRTDMGGPHAERSVEEGAASIVAAVSLDQTGGFFRDGKPISW